MQLQLLQCLNKIHSIFMLVKLVCSNGDEIEVEDDGCGTWTVRTYDPVDVSRLSPMQSITLVTLNVYNFLRY